MAKLVKCKLCDKEISNEVKVCPNCGHKQAKNNRLYMLVFVMIFVLVCYFISGSEDRVKNGGDVGINSAEATTNSAELANENDEHEQNLNNSDTEKFCMNNIYDMCISKCKEKFNHEIDVDVVCTECSAKVGRIPAATLNKIAVCIGYRDGGWIDNSISHSKRNFEELLSLEIFNAISSSNSDDPQTKSDKKTRSLIVYSAYETSYNKTAIFWAKKDGEITPECYRVWKNMVNASNRIEKLKEALDSGVITASDYNNRYNPQDDKVVNDSWAYLLPNCPFPKESGTDDFNVAYQKYGEEHNN